MCCRHTSKTAEFLCRGRVRRGLSYRHPYDTGPKGQNRNAHIVRPLLTGVNLEDGLSLVSEAGGSGSCEEELEDGSGGWLVLDPPCGKIVNGDGQRGSIDAGGPVHRSRSWLRLSWTKRESREKTNMSAGGAEEQGRDWLEGARVAT